MDQNKIQWNNKIGTGATADIFAYGDYQVIKVFHEDKSDSAEKEYQIQKAVNATGLLTPKVSEYVGEEKVCGYVMERIQGQTLLEQMLAPNADIEKIIHKYACLQHQIHINQAVAGIEDGYDKFSWAISQNNELTAMEIQTIQNLLTEQNRESSLCHMDFHPGNVIVTKDGLYVIDWMDAVSGNHYADIARTSFVFLSDEVPSDVSLETAASILSLKKELNCLYQKELSRLEPIDEKLLSKWQIIIAAVRLPWAKEEEKEMYLDLIRKRI